MTKEEFFLRSICWMTKKHPTFQEASDLLIYDPITGGFAWRVDRFCGRGRIFALAGSVAGSIDGSTGYWRIGINYVRCHGHRLAWLLTHGSWPDGDIDHINGERSDNRIVNLRDISHRANLENRKAANANSKSSVLGVSPVPGGKWVAKITIKSQPKYLGTFETKEDAHLAYLIAKRSGHTGCTI